MTRRPVPDDQFGGRLRGAYLVELAVVQVDDPAPHVRAITFGSPDLVEFTFDAGQDLMIEFPNGEASLRRRYTIRSGDPIAGTIVIEFEMHGNGAAARWAANAAIGEQLDAIGPRGSMTLDASAQSHVFIADDSAMPATFAMLEALPPDAAATAILVTPSGPDSRPSTSAAGATLVWVNDIADMDDAITQLDIGPDTIAYANGERRLVVDSVDRLTTAGIPADRISSKAYWRRDQPNAAHGEPTR